MDKNKSKNITIILTCTGIFFILLTAFDFANEYEQGFLFIGVISLFGALGARLIAERDEGKH